MLDEEGDGSSDGRTGVVVVVVVVVIVGVVVRLLDEEGDGSSDGCTQPPICEPPFQLSPH